MRLWVTQEILQVVLPYFFVLSEGRLERNSVAAFLLMVKNLIRHHPVNQESLLHCHGPSIIGAMLSKVSAPHVSLLQQAGTICGKG